MLGDAWPLVTAAEMRALDRHTIETLGVPGALLMELRRARRWPAKRSALRAAGAPVWVICGAGSNGGDGLVAARQLQLRGVPVRVVAARRSARAGAATPPRTGSASRRSASRSPMGKRVPSPAP